MKKITSYLLLLIYANGLFASVTPLVNDAFAHMFWRAEHMATVHCVNGQYHVHYELYKAGNTDSKKNNAAKSDEVFSLHIQPAGNSTNFVFWSKPFTLKDTEGIDSPFIRINIPPPKQA